LSVLAALVEAMPNADYSYFADTAFVPYGNKSDEFIRQRVLAIGGELVKRGCTLLVVACNTATVAAVSALRERYPDVPIVGIEPGIKPAAQTTQSGKIAVLVTEATANSERLARLIHDHAQGLQVFVEPCPGWATQVEQLQFDSPDLRNDAAARLRPLLDNGVDRIVLGCTHYSFLRPLLQPLLDGRAELIDVADAVARQTVRLYGEGDANGGDAGSITLLASANPGRLLAALPRLGLPALAARVSTAALTTV
jgi:glutamate racemase